MELLSELPKNIIFVRILRENAKSINEFRTKASFATEGFLLQPSMENPPSFGIRAMNSDSEEKV